MQRKHQVERFTTCDDEDAWEPEIELVYGSASSSIGPDAPPPSIFLRGPGGWFRRELLPPRYPLGFRPTRPRRPAALPETPVCD